MQGKGLNEGNQPLTNKTQEQSTHPNPMSGHPSNRILSALPTGSQTLRIAGGNIKNDSPSSNINQTMSRIPEPTYQQPGIQITSGKPSTKMFLNGLVNNRVNNSIWGVSNQPEIKSNASTINTEPQSLNSLKGFFKHENESLQSNPVDDGLKKAPIPGIENNQQNNISTKADSNMLKGECFRLSCYLVITVALNMYIV